jgi:hypothetical protein
MATTRLDQGNGYIDIEDAVVLIEDRTGRGE